MEEGKREKLACSIAESKDGILFLKLNFVSSFGKML